METLLWIALFLPLGGFAILLATSAWISRKGAGIIGCTTVLFSFLIFAYLLLNYTSPWTTTLFSWVPVPSIDAHFSLHIDPLSLLMALIITGVGFLIHVYSIGYMEHDPFYPRYFACMNFFIFSMLLLVLAGHLLVLFIGWEGVGLASYLLIGFDYDRPAAAAAATKAFVVNRIGDLGLLLGLLLCFQVFGTGDIVEINKRAAEFPVGSGVITILTLLLFIGAIGKSAQLPLYTWLPDAMEGPTPVSALIHAATMVTAGVFLVVQMHSLFLQAPLTLQIVGIIGGITSLYAALCAMGQTDLKRVLAYSTVSQLGLMFLACGIGAFYAAMFHLTTHAFIKALLFLSAGNVVHMLHGTTEMGQMGGLSKTFTKTHVLFLIGVLALSGIPPLAAFFSKDLILEQEYLVGPKTLFYVAFIASVLTAFYLTRAYCLTFLGKPKGDFKNVHEAPANMLIPVFLLGLLSLVGGFLGYAFGKTPILEAFLAKIGVTLAKEEPGVDFIWSLETLFAVFGGLAGVVTAAVLYTRYVDRLGVTWAFLKNSFYVDSLYDALFVNPLKALSNGIAHLLEPRVFEGALQSTAQLTQGIAAQFQQVQSGQIRGYVAWIVFGLVFLMLFLAL